MGGWGSFGYGQSESDARSASGLRGTAYQNQAAEQSYNAASNYQNVANEFQRDPFHFQGKTGAELLPGGRYGLGSNADAGVEEMINYANSLSSADVGSRGFLHPENRANVVGSAVTRALPGLIPQLQQWQMNQFQAPRFQKNSDSPMAYISNAMPQHSKGRRVTAIATRAERCPAAQAQVAPSVRHRRPRR